MPPVSSSRASFRKLLWHAESECLWETFSESEFEAAMQQDCSDVTDIPEYEELFKEVKAK